MRELELGNMGKERKKKQISNFVPEKETDISATDNTTNRRTNRNPTTLKYYESYN
jgi:hypothetical protein